MTTTTATQAKLLTAGDLLRLYSKGVRGELIEPVASDRNAGRSAGYSLAGHRCRPWKTPRTSRRSLRTRYGTR